MSAAAFSRTMSRTGPGRPVKVSRATRPLNTASAPRRSSGFAGGMPRSEGSKVVSVAVPSRTTHTVEVPVVVSSSSPSSPRNTSEEQPRAANTPAITPAIRGWKTPTAWARGGPGSSAGRGS